MTAKDDFLDVTLSTGDSLPAAYLNSINEILQPYNITAAETSAGVTPTNYAYDSTPYYELPRHGAVGDDSTDNTTAIQSWLNVLEQSGEAGIVPAGIYRHDDLTLNGSSMRGLKIRGVSTGEYVSTSTNAPTRGSIFKYTGTGQGLLIDRGAAPKYVQIEGITFVGNASATAGVAVRRSTNLRFRDCVWWGYSNTAAGAAGLVLNTNSGEFVGVIDIERCNFAINYRAFHSVYSSVNVINFLESQFHSNDYAVVNGQSGIATDSRSWNFWGCDFEENAQDILSHGGAQAWTILASYFENNDNAETLPRIHFDANGSSPSHSGLLIMGNTFSKALQNAGDKLIALEGVLGATIKSNWTAFPTAAMGSVTDRWFVEADSACTNLEIDPLRVVSGATPYPIRINGVSYSTGYDSRASRLVGAVTLDNLSVTPVVNTQSSAYTIQATDAGPGKLLVNGGATTTYTIEDFATVPIPVGSTVKVCNSHSSNNLTIGRSGVALYQGNADSDLTVGPRRIVYLTHISTDVWVVEDASGLS